MISDVPFRQAIILLNMSYVNDTKKSFDFDSFTSDLDKKCENQNKIFLFYYQT